METHLEQTNRNNFGLIRLIAACMVVETHSHLYSPESKNNYFDGSFHLSFLGLPAFFFLSGLLVTQSLYKSPSRVNFVWKRLLRLCPAAWFAILVAAFIIGPWVTGYPLKDYFSSPILYQYLSSCTLIHISYHLPGVFTQSLLQTDAVNSSLWTIGLELKLYLALLAFSFLHSRYQKIVLPTLIGMLILTFLFLERGGRGDSIMGRIAMPYLSYGVQFLSGSLCYLLRDRIRSRRYWFFLLPAAFYLSMRLNILSVTIYFLLPALVIFAATHAVDMGRTITPRADLSYGIYVFAFPVEQLVVHYLHPPNALTLFGLTLLFVLPFALLSWYGVEKPALRLKTKIS